MKKLIISITITAFLAFYFGCTENQASWSPVAPGTVSDSAEIAGAQEQQQMLVKLANVENSVQQLETLVADLKKGVTGAATSLEAQASSLSLAAEDLSEEDLAVLDSPEYNVSARLGALAASIEIIMNDTQLPSLLNASQFENLMTSLTVISEEDLAPVIASFGYQIGDIGPAGGIIFYDDTDDGIDDIPGVRYLELAPADTTFRALWGIYGEDIAGAEGKGLGDEYSALIPLLKQWYQRRVLLCLAAGERGRAIARGGCRRDRRPSDVCQLARENMGTASKNSSCILDGHVERPRGCSCLCSERPGFRGCSACLDRHRTARRCRAESASPP